MMENEGVYTDNEGVENVRRVTIYTNALPNDKKGYCLRHPPNTNYHEKRDNWCSICWSKLIVGSCALHNAAMTYANVINTIANFVENTPPKKIITNETILTQYIIKKVLQIFRQKCEAAVQK